MVVYISCHIATLKRNEVLEKQEQISYDNITRSKAFNPFIFFSLIKLKKLKLSIKSNGNATLIRIFKVISLKDSSLESPWLLYVYNWISNKKHDTSTFGANTN